ncbi:branched-chain amino acid ABC transporter permease [Bradyrhizobium sp. 186]|uniref:branched-chain amino acid ABC transporter permease n=1 Tax=Bradyrhizobium sp. 186 TaxID=2782654 RepID=UPI002001207B|nr:branched-chain amino acid ABC transporter permease [Bradyrhizobium sp. 186]UPK38539.1 branched-chain amino acid ABC transporter permease [Bradyrhizobium sp. 186]
MSFDIGFILVQNGVANGALYALLSLALVLVFSVTRIVFVPIGEFVSFGALTLAAFQDGKVPQIAWFVPLLGACGGALRCWSEREGLSGRDFLRVALLYVVCPVMTLGLSVAFRSSAMPVWLAILLTVLLLSQLGVYIYDLVYRPLVEGSVLVLLIVSVVLHVLMVNVGLLLFGAEGSRSPALLSAGLEIGSLRVDGQSIAIVAITAALIVLLYGFFGRTLLGKALRATAVNRLGSQLMGVSPAVCGRFALVIATSIGALCGILISSTTTIYYDTGFLIGLKGFVSAIIGGMISYPLAALGGLIVGQIESFASFQASALKEVIVFTMIIPVLLWRSFRTVTVEDDE